MKKVDYELVPSHKVALMHTDMSKWNQEAIVLDYGMIVICRSGTTTLHVNFDIYELNKDDVITLFPNDVLSKTYASSDFSVEVLRYDASILREASLQLEQTVYHQLREDRCRRKSPILTSIINTMFTLLKIYFEQKECKCLEQLVLLQLKAFFIGFYDYLSRFPQEKHERKVSRRTQELFNLFMITLEEKYQESRDVSYYANKLHITPKYLNTLVHRVTNHKVKTVIDHYAILQLKLTLRNSTNTVKEIAWNHHFSDVSFFCRYFKQHTGLTPQQFRKKL